MPTLPEFADRHIGPRESDIATMLATVGYDSLADLVDAFPQVAA